MAPVPFSTICFRTRPKNLTGEQIDRLNEELMDSVNSTGSIFLSHTKLQGRFTLRLAIGNIRTTEKHVALAWKLLKEKLL